METKLRAEQTTVNIALHRAPTTTDIEPLGRVWHDISYGAAGSGSLDYVSHGNGVWQCVNTLKLRALRLYVHSISASYPACSSIRFLDKTGATYNYNQWIMGARSDSFFAPAVGSQYNGGNCVPPNKTVGWVEFEPSATLDQSRGFSGGWASLRGDTLSTGITMVELHFLNNPASVKRFNCAGSYGGDKQFLALDPAEALQHGSGVPLVLGVPKVSSELANPADINAGLVSGSALTTAVAQLIQPVLERVAALEARLP